MKDHLMFPHRSEILDAQVTCHLVQFRHRHRLKLGDIERGGDVVLVRLFFGSFVPFWRAFVFKLLRFGGFHWRGGRAQVLGGRPLGPLGNGRGCGIAFVHRAIRWLNGERTAGFFGSLRGSWHISNIVN